MKISLEWLSEFVELLEKDPEAIARVITAKVAEVDEVEVQGKMLEHVVVGKILTVKKHPNADTLLLCDVETEKGTKRVVCGGTNLVEGRLVAFAHIGATVRWHGTEVAKIERAKIRGEESEGMICASEELELGNQFPPKPEDGARPIMDLTPLHLKVGAPLREALGLSDVILHIDNHAITHRPDLFSHQGFAREFVAVGLAKAKGKSAEKRPSFPLDPLPFDCVSQSRKLMPRYCACLLEIPSLGQTPDWMKRRLEATGIRSISLPVDITNYVMLEIGVPLHSFDANDFKGDITVRKAKRGEHITTLDSIDRELPAGAIVISDDEGIFDLLGIMGGLRSSTKDTTRRVYLHAASLDPASIRMTVTKTGHRTEAATVYEKGVPHVITEEGFFRALSLFLSLIPGSRIVSRLETFGDNGSPKPITLNLKRTERLLGTPVAAERAKEILRHLGFTVQEKGRALSITTPLWRTDIHGEHDLAEEIGRILGYDTIESALPSASVFPPPRDHRLHHLREALKEGGFIETVPLSLVGDTLLKKAGMDPSDAHTIENPLGEELAHPHPSTIPALLEHAAKNLPLVEHILQTFTCAHVFTKGKGEWFECGFLATSRGESPLKQMPLLCLRQEISDALGQAGWSMSVKAGTPAPFGHPGRSASLFVGSTPVGSITEVHPQVLERFGLPARTAVATLNLTSLLALPSTVTKPAPLPSFPAVTYDVTMKRSQQQNTEELLKKLRTSSVLLEDVSIVDLFDGAPLKNDEYNLTLRFTYRAKDRTLTEDEAKKEQEKVLAEVGTGK